MASVLRPQVDRSMRSSSNKEMFEKYDDLFDQYLETDLLEFSDTTLERPSPDHLAGLFEDPSSNGRNRVAASSVPKLEVRTDGAWHKALRHLEQNPASPSFQGHQSSVYPESRGRASASDPEIISVDELRSPQSQSSSRVSSSTPTTPTPSAPKHKPRIAAAIAQPVASRFANGVRKSSQKSSTSPKMMRPSQYRSASYHDVWAKRVDASADAFNFQLPSTIIPATPPRSAKLSQGQNPTAFLSDCDDFNLTTTVATGFEEHKNDPHDQSNYQLTPLSSPAIDHNSSNRNSSFGSTHDPISSGYFAHQLSNEALSALQTPPPSQRLPVASWGADTADNFDFNLPASPDFNGSQKQQGWWPSGNAPQPSPTYQHSRRESQNMGFVSVPASGLGISCDLSGFGETNASASGYPPLSAQQLSMYANSMAPAHPYGVTTPPSRSPSTSPPPHRLSHRRTSSRHRQHSSNHHRRKSSNSSNSTGPRPASVGFVNFTPDDSRKILTGVAPSGSSKTKARREKEAADKRRKLSQAATRAIIEAGGNLAELERQGLLSFTAEE